MIHSRKALTIGLLLMVALAAEAQNTSGDVRVYPGPSRVIIVLSRTPLHPSMPSKEGWVACNVYRLEPPAQQPVLLNSAPIQRPATLEEYESAYGPLEPAFLTLCGVRDRKEFWHKVVTQTDRITNLAFVLPEFGASLGLLYFDTTVTPQHRYTYHVVHVNARGNETSASPPVTVTVGAAPVPVLPPMHVRLTADTASVLLEWQLDPRDHAVRGYHVYRSDTQDTTMHRVTPHMIIASRTSQQVNGSAWYRDASVRPGIVYSYAIVGEDYGGNPGAIAPVYSIETRDSTAPPSPRNVQARATTAGIVVQWERVHASDLAGYFISRLDPKTRTLGRLTDVPVPARDSVYCDTHVETGATYSYAVEAVDVWGNCSAPSAEGTVTCRNPQPPLAPQGVRARTDEHGGILVQWRRNDEPDLQGYIVYRVEHVNGVAAPVSPVLSAKTDAFTDADSSLSPTINYWYRVRAVNTSGTESLLSLPAIAAPVRRREVEIPSNFHGYADASGYRLFWQPNPDASVAGYHVYVGDATAKGRWLRITHDPLPQSSSSHTVSTSRAPSSSFCITAVGAGGNESTRSREITLYAYTAAPAPGNVRVSQTGDSVLIRWDRVENEGVANFRVRQQSVPHDPMNAKEWTVAANVSHLMAGSVRKGHRYVYSITAVGRSGGESRSIDSPCILIR